MQLVVVKSVAKALLREGSTRCVYDDALGATYHALA